MGAPQRSPVPPTRVCPASADPIPRAQNGRARLLTRSLARSPARPRARPRARALARSRRYRKPLTTSHEVGWHAAGPTAPSLRYADNHPRRATEITTNEGMSLEQYYG